MRNRWFDSKDNEEEGAGVVREEGEKGEEEKVENRKVLKRKA